MKIAYLLLLSFLFFASCRNKNHENSTINTAISTEVEKPVPVSQSVSKADSIINKAIKAHGGDLYNSAHYSFIFRNNKYTFKNNGNSYTYTVKGNDKNNIPYFDVVDNGKFSKEVNGQLISLSQKDVERYKNALNSVVYFALLPYKLRDPAVNKKFIETISIKEKAYNVIEVTFNKQGGGKDYDDQFYYWVNTKTNKIDYLAYNYKVNKGGVRFRSFYNRRIIGGVTFQDYINWKAEVGIPLKDLPKLFETGELKELSRIETENVVRLKN